MKVKNIRHLMLGIICLVLAVICLAVGAAGGSAPNISSAPSCYWLWAL